MREGILFCTDPFISSELANPERLQELRLIFETPPLYGSDIDWKTYAAYEAEATLYVYLSSLPEPLIHREFAERLWRFLSKYSHSEVQVFRDVLATLQKSRHHLVTFLLVVFARWVSKKSPIVLLADPQTVIMQIARRYHRVFSSLEHGADTVDHEIQLLAFMIENGDRLEEYETKWRIQ
ncbi:hypothetical protein K491DRAFT_713260 [Lophiostoma macrostomum CBS 122681]|uniref:Rho-GAP domain-containing protein n=1 Tax=Lophiostoma macrostomum CBS 122681 TaxID=1314788 RepID=A0A6A6THG0_9PLEO|nr:hypothetical protein K491DRAFT_713260 [Lophiostoma macrostomum CBS 122681]